MLTEIVPHFNKRYYSFGHTSVWSINCFENKKTYLSLLKFLHTRKSWTTYLKKRKSKIERKSNFERVLPNTSRHSKTRRKTHNLTNAWLVFSTRTSNDMHLIVYNYTHNLTAAAGCHYELFPFSRWPAVHCFMPGGRNRQENWTTTTIHWCNGFSSQEDPWWFVLFLLSCIIITLLWR